MSSERGPRCGGVFAGHGRSDGGNGLHRPQGFPEWLRVDELASSVDAVTGAVIGPYQKSRLDQPIHAPSDRGGAPTLNAPTDCLIRIDSFLAACGVDNAHAAGAEGRRTNELA